MTALSRANLLLVSGCKIGLRRRVYATSHRFRARTDFRCGRSLGREGPHLDTACTPFVSRLAFSVSIPLLESLLSMMLLSAGCIISVMSAVLVVSAFAAGVISAVLSRFWMLHGPPLRGMEVPRPTPFLFSKAMKVLRMALFVEYSRYRYPTYVR